MMFIPYVCCGDPNLKFTHKLIKVLSKTADVIELGIPFSDPIADGKTIQFAANRALQNEVNVEKIFFMVKRLRKGGLHTPLVFMTYYNIVFAYGKERFLKKMNELKMQGIIIPDLPFGEDKEFEQLAKNYNISIIHLIAPNTPAERTKKLLADSGMFTYLVSVTGTTGARKNVNSESLAFVKRIRKLAGKERSLCVGFGISNPNQAKDFVKAGASGVIVGSKLIEIYSKHIQKEKINSKSALKEISAFANRFSLKQVP